MPALKTRNLFISHAWNYSEQYNTVVGWLNNANNFDWRNFSIEVEKPLDTNNDKELEGKITNKINLTHSLIVLSGMYVNHRRWIEYEMNEAIRLGKTIIGVKPWGNEKMPKFVTAHADVIVNWQSKSLIDAIRANVRV